ncbi:nucleotidyltransferase domain-containing protein [Methylobacterium aquaticum]|nr:nucleotidyltransferase [Methylobacterium aquaticum]
MNHPFPKFETDPLEDPLDALLVDVAVRVQLPPGLHAKACGRGESVCNHIDRKGSPLEGRVLRFYPQGSMRIDATISTRGTDEEYDLDYVAELDEHHLAPPDAVLDLVHQALRDYPTRRAVVRQTRCVTVFFADGMHVDVTPSALLPHGAERESHIFHANPEKPANEHSHVPMNAYGFGDWYNDRTPVERRFADAVNRRIYEAAGTEIRADAQFDEVPDQVPLIVKSVTTVALQLIKRHRNVVYAGETGRIPPSVMLSCIAGEVSSPGLPLSDMVIRLARAIARKLMAASARREKVSVVNPIFPNDQFTDRWPENRRQQDDYAAKLTELADGLEYIKRHGSSLEDTQDWLRDRFGSHVVASSIRRFNERTGRAVQSGEHAYTSRGRLYVPSRPALIGLGGATAAATAPARAVAHTFRGGRR